MHRATLSVVGRSSVMPATLHDWKSPGKRRRRICHRPASVCCLLDSILLHQREVRACFVRGKEEGEGEGEGEEDDDEEEEEGEEEEEEGV